MVMELLVLCFLALCFLALLWGVAVLLRGCCRFCCPCCCRRPGERPRPHRPEAGASVVRTGLTSDADFNERLAIAERLLPQFFGGDSKWAKLGEDVVNDAALTTDKLTDHLGHEPREHWYPACLSADLPSPAAWKAPPAAACLLGEPLVLYRDKKRAVHCLADRCPRCSGPLRVGWVHFGKLECASDGLQFDGAVETGAGGKCTGIPGLGIWPPVCPQQHSMMLKTTAHDWRCTKCSKHCPEGSKMFRCTTCRPHYVHNVCVSCAREALLAIPDTARTREYRAVERDGVVWVWLGRAAPHARVPPHHPIQEDPAFLVQRFSVDLPIDHTVMVENLLNPAHTLSAYSGHLIPARSLPMRMAVTPSAWLVGKGLGAGHRGVQGQVTEGYVNEFVAPCAVHLFTSSWRKRTGCTMMEFFYCVPSAPGHMRLVYLSYRNWANSRWATLARNMGSLALWFCSLVSLSGFVSRHLGALITPPSLKTIFQDYERLFAQQQRLREGARVWEQLQLQQQQQQRRLRGEAPIEPRILHSDRLLLLYRDWHDRVFGRVFGPVKPGVWWIGWDGEDGCRYADGAVGATADVAATAAWNCTAASDRTPDHHLNPLRQSPAQKSGGFLPDFPRWLACLLVISIGCSFMIATGVTCIYRGMSALQFEVETCMEQGGLGLCKLGMDWLIKVESWNWDDEHWSPDWLGLRMIGLRSEYNRTAA